MIRKRIRHLQRYREIVNALVRHGFGFVIKDMGLFERLSISKRVLPKQRKGLQTKTIGERIRLFLEDLGPTFIKLGQVASTRYDLLPADVIAELEKMQDQAQPFTFDIVEQIVEEELGDSVENSFQKFSEKPLAAASIGQVHEAVLKTGEHVAVKIQRPNMLATIETDLDILKDLAMIAEQRLEWADRYQVRDIVDEFSQSLLEELDYTVEGRNAEKIGKQFQDDPKVIIPKVYWEYTTEKVLTMEYVKGIKLNETEKIIALGNNRQILAERIVDAILKQILIAGYFHGDPHPGNVLAGSDNTIIFLDFGSVGRLSPELKYHIASLVIALMRKKTEDVIKAITNMGIVPDDINMTSLRADVDQLYEKYYDVALSMVSLGHVINDLFAVAYKHHIRIPPDLTLLGKTLLTMEGMVVKLDPELSILKVAEPFGRRLLMQRYDPKNVAGNLWDQLVEMGEFISDFPKTLKEITTLLKNGKMKQELSFPEKGFKLNQLDRISNRISFSISLLSFSIILAGLIVATAISGRPLLNIEKIPAVEIGIGIATSLFVWLMISIFKGGKF